MHARPDRPARPWARTNVVAQSRAIRCAWLHQLSIVDAGNHLVRSSSHARSHLRDLACRWSDAPSRNIAGNRRRRRVATGRIRSVPV